MPQTGFVTTAPVAVPRTSRWTAGRIAALVVGGLFTLWSLGLLSTGSLLLWADRSQRDGGFLTTPSVAFSTQGSALVTMPTEMGQGGTGWLYSPGLLGDVRIRVTPQNPNEQLFVGIAPTGEVQGYLSGVSQGYITEYFRGQLEELGGTSPATLPAHQTFWTASSQGAGTRTVTWRPVNGSWTVVVMNADGTSGINVRADLGAKVPSVPWIGFGLVVAGLIFLAGGVLLIVGAVRRVRKSVA